MSNRHLSRIIVMQSIFERDFRPDSDIFEIIKRNIDAFQEDCDLEYIDICAKGIIDNQEKIDEIITKAAPEWPLEQIAAIDKAILRVAVFELLFDQDVPPKVVINEAVELGKTYGSENSFKFVNGVLGTLFKQDERFEKLSKEEQVTLLDLDISKD
ncbi:MAG: transcription antitermination protein NusB [uncultured bacterium]|nr:MAG: transcription antitermination protein NusB [uncultured bacterium]